MLMNEAGDIKVLNPQIFPYDGQKGGKQNLALYKISVFPRIMLSLEM